MHYSDRPFVVLYCNDNNNWSHDFGLEKIRKASALSHYSVMNCFTKCRTQMLIYASAWYTSASYVQFNWMGQCSCSNPPRFALSSGEKEHHKPSNCLAKVTCYAVLDYYPSKELRVNPSRRLQLNQKVTNHIPTSPGTSKGIFTIKWYEFELQWTSLSNIQDI